MRVRPVGKFREVVKMMIHEEVLPPPVARRKVSEPLLWEQIRQLPPSEINDPIHFGAKHADAISRFLLVCDLIQRSTWYNSEQVAGFRGKGRAGLTAAPAMESTVTVLFYFKLLVGSDELFNQLCTYYVKFVDAEEKRAFVKAHRQHTIDILNHVPDSLSVGKIVATNQQFLYAFWTVMLASHSRSQDENRALTVAFRKIYELRDERNTVLTTFNYLLLRLYSHIAAVGALVAMDFEYWLKNQRIPLPDLAWRENILTWQDRSE